jgi:putative membrane protein
MKRRLNRHKRHDTMRQFQTVAIIAGLNCAVGLPAFWALSTGPVAREMAIHIALMSFAAPSAAAVLFAMGLFQPAAQRWLWPATILQLLLLFCLHVPGLHRAMMEPGLLRAFSLAALVLAATQFWRCLLSNRPPSPPWQEILALLLTAKLVCLLAVLLVFAPRQLYMGAGHLGDGIVDQQAAGLLMLIACPLTYLIPAITLATRLLPSRSGDARKAVLSDHPA